MEEAIWAPSGIQTPSDVINCRRLFGPRSSATARKLAGSGLIKDHDGDMLALPIAHPPASTHDTSVISTTMDAAAVATSGQLGHGEDLVAGASRDPQPDDMHGGDAVAAAPKDRQPDKVHEEDVATAASMEYKADNIHGGNIAAAAVSAREPEHPIPALPQELIDLIIELLVRSSGSAPHARRRGDSAVDAVGQCMLASRAFLMSVRRTLFEHVTLRDARRAPAIGALPTSETARMDGLLAAFRADPLRASAHPLTAHVRSIRVVLDPAEGRAMDGSAGVGLGGVGSGLAGGLHKDAGAAVLDWNARRVGLREVLRATGRLERFAFEFLAPTSGHALHVGIALAVEKVCRAPQLTRLEFTNLYHFPVDLLAGCVNLRALRLVNVFTRDPEWSKSVAARQKRYAPTLLPAMWGRESLKRLEVLEAENAGEVLDEISNPTGVKAPWNFSFRHVKLRSFKLGIPTKVGADTMREVIIMLETAATLESLTIRGITSDTRKRNHYSYCDPLLTHTRLHTALILCPGRLVLSSFFALRTLHLHLTFSSMALFGQMPPSLDALLGEHVRGPTTIEHVTFDVIVKVAHFNSKFNTLKLEPDPAWAALDHHLTNGARYPVLLSVAFRVLVVHQHLLPTPLFPGPDSWEEMHELKGVLVESFESLGRKLFQAVQQSQRIKYKFSLDFGGAESEV